MKPPVTYKASMGSLYYTKCTMELPRCHIIVYMPIDPVRSFKYGHFSYDLSNMDVFWSFNIY